MGHPHRATAPVPAPESPPRAAPVIEPLPLGPRASVLQQLLDGEGWGALRPTLDAFALGVAVLLTMNWPGESIPLDAGWPLVLFPVPVMLILWARGLYGRRLRASVLEGIAPVAGAISIATTMLVVMEVYLVGDRMELGALTHVWALSLLTLGGSRILLVGLQHLARTPRLDRPAGAHHRRR